MPRRAGRAWGNPLAPPKFVAPRPVTRKPVAGVKPVSLAVKRVGNRGGLRSNAFSPPFRPITMSAYRGAAPVRVATARFPKPVVSRPVASRPKRGRYERGGFRYAPGAAPRPQGKGGYEATKPARDWLANAVVDASSFLGKQFATGVANAPRTYGPIVNFDGKSVKLAKAGVPSEAEAKKIADKLYAGEKSGALWTLHQSARVPHGVSGGLIDSIEKIKRISKGDFVDGPSYGSRAYQGFIKNTPYTGADVLKSAGVSAKHKAILGLGGFGLDVLTDPLTYVGGGSAAVARKGSMAAVTKVAMSKGVQEARRTSIKAAEKEGEHAVKTYRAGLKAKAERKVKTKAQDAKNRGTVLTTTQKDAIRAQDRFQPKAHREDALRQRANFNHGVNDNVFLNPTRKEAKAAALAEIKAIEAKGGRLTEAQKAEILNKHLRQSVSKFGRKQQASGLLDTPLARSAARRGELAAYARGQKFTFAGQVFGRTRNDPLGLKINRRVRDGSYDITKNPVYVQEPVRGSITNIFPGLRSSRTRVTDTAFKEFLAGTRDLGSGFNATVRPSIMHRYDWEQSKHYVASARAAQDRARRKALEWENGLGKRIPLDKHGDFVHALEHPFSVTAVKAMPKNLREALGHVKNAGLDPHVVFGLTSLTGQGAEHVAGTGMKIGRGISADDVFKAGLEHAVAAGKVTAKDVKVIKRVRARLHSSESASVAKWLRVSRTAKKHQQLLAVLGEQSVADIKAVLAHFERRSASDLANAKSPAARAAFGALWRKQIDVAKTGAFRPLFDIADPTVRIDLLSAALTKALHRENPEWAGRSGLVNAVRLGLEADYKAARRAGLPVQHHENFFPHVDKRHLNEIAKSFSIKRTLRNAQDEIQSVWSRGGFRGPEAVNVTSEGSGLEALDPTRFGMKKYDLSASMSESFLMPRKIRGTSRFISKNLVQATAKVRRGEETSVEQYLALYRGVSENVPMVIGAYKKTIGIATANATFATRALEALGKPVNTFWELPKGPPMVTAKVHAFVNGHQKAWEDLVHAIESKDPARIEAAQWQMSRFKHEGLPINRPLSSAEAKQVAHERFKFENAVHEEHAAQILPIIEKADALEAAQKALKGRSLNAPEIKVAGGISVSRADLHGALRALNVIEKTITEITNTGRRAAGLGNMSPQQAIGNFARKAVDAGPLAEFVAARHGVESTLLSRIMPGGDLTGVMNVPKEVASSLAMDESARQFILDHAVLGDMLTSFYDGVHPLFNTASNNLLAENGHVWGHAEFTDLHMGLAGLTAPVAKDATVPGLKDLLPLADKQGRVFEQVFDPKGTAKSLGRRMSDRSPDPVYDPTPAGINSMDWGHGGHPIPSIEFWDDSFFSEYGLVGPQLYGSNKPEIRTDYLQKEAEAVAALGQKTTDHRMVLDVKNPVDLQAEGVDSPEFMAALRDLRTNVYDAAIKRVSSFSSKESLARGGGTRWNAKHKNKVIDDLIKQRDRGSANLVLNPSYVHRWGKDGDQLFNTRNDEIVRDLLREFRDDHMLINELKGVFRDTLYGQHGFDSMTHIGGNRWGSQYGEHQVITILDKSALKSIEPQGSKWSWDHPVSGEHDSGAPLGQPTRKFNEEARWMGLGQNKITLTHDGQQYSVVPNFENSYATAGQPGNPFQSAMNPLDAPLGMQSTGAETAAQMGRRVANVQRDLPQLSAIGLPPFDPTNTKTFFDMVNSADWGVVAKRLREQHAEMVGNGQGNRWTRSSVPQQGDSITWLAENKMRELGRPLTEKDVQELTNQRGNSGVFLHLQNGRVTPLSLEDSTRLLNDGPVSHTVFEKRGTAADLKNARVMRQRASKRVNEALKKKDKIVNDIEDQLKGNWHSAGNPLTKLQSDVHQIIYDFEAESVLQQFKKLDESDGDFIFASGRSYPSVPINLAYVQSDSRLGPAIMNAVGWYLDNTPWNELPLPPAVAERLVKSIEDVAVHAKAHADISSAEKLLNERVPKTVVTPSFLTRPPKYEDVIGKDGLPILDPKTKMGLKQNVGGLGGGQVHYLEKAKADMVFNESTISARQISPNYYQRALGTWKFLVTQAMPAFWVRNFVGDTQNSVLAQGAPSHIANIQNAWRIGHYIKHMERLDEARLFDPFKRPSNSLKALGEQWIDMSDKSALGMLRRSRRLWTGHGQMMPGMTVAEAARIAIEDGVANAGLAYRDLATTLHGETALYRNKMYAGKSPASLRSTRSRRYLDAKLFGDQQISRANPARYANPRRQGFVGPLKKFDPSVAKNLDYAINPKLTRPWFGTDKRGFRQRMEQNSNFRENSSGRLNTWLGGMQQTGGNRVAASRLATRHHFDYGDLSKYEEWVRRNALPFYTWNARNIPLWSAALYQRPGMIAGFEMAREEAAQYSGAPKGWERGLNQTEQKALPFALFGQSVSFGSGGVSISSAEQGPGAVFGGLSGMSGIDTLRNVSDFALGLLSPLGKVPLELTANYSFYTHKKIQDDKFPTVPAPLWVNNIANSGPAGKFLATKWLGYIPNFTDKNNRHNNAPGWSGRVDYLAQQAPGIMQLLFKLAKRPSENPNAKIEPWRTGLSVVTGLRVRELSAGGSQINILNDAIRLVDTRLAGLRQSKIDGYPQQVGNASPEFVELTIQKRIMVQSRDNLKRALGYPMDQKSGGRGRTSSGSSSGSFSSGGFVGTKTRSPFSH